MSDETPSPPREMITALDADPSLLDMHERAFVGKVREHGWTQMAIGEDANGPNFDYTTGFWLNLGFPEVIAFGLPEGAANDLFWHMYRTLEGGQAFPIREPLDALFTSSKAFLLPVSEQAIDKYMTWTRWFYARSNPIRCVQLVWPDRGGNFPWNPGCEEALRELQPDLTGAHWAGLQRH